MIKTSEKSKKRRSNLIDCSEELFYKFGYANIDVDDIVQAAGVSHGTFYYYFTSKEDIVEAIVARNFSEVVPKYREAESQQELTAYDKFILLRRLLRQRGQEGKGREFFKNLFADKYLHILDKIRRQRDEYIKPLFLEIVLEGNQKGEWHVLYPTEAVNIYFAIMHVVAEAYYAEEGKDFEKSLALSVQLIKQLFGVELNSFFEEDILRKMID